MERARKSLILLTEEEKLAFAELSTQNLCFTYRKNLLRAKRNGNIGDMPYKVRKRLREMGLLTFAFGEYDKFHKKYFTVWHPTAKCLEYLSEET